MNAKQMMQAMQAANYVAADREVSTMAGYVARNVVDMVTEKAKAGWLGGKSMGGEFATGWAYAEFERTQKALPAQAE